MPEYLFRFLAFVGGAFLIISTVLAAVRSFILPRNESVLINNVAFTGVRYIFNLMASWQNTYARRDRLMALYAPIGLVTLPIVWLALVSFGYILIFWALGEEDIIQCYRLSSSALLTLGAENAESVWISAFSYSEAGLGLLLITLLISYLPTMYQAFSRRELVVARLELRAGADRSACDLIMWLNRTGSLTDDGIQWERWEEWFVEIEETHTSLPILSFFRSPQPGRSWVMAASIILDAAAVILSSVDQARDPQIELTFKAGCVAINRVFRFFHVSAQSEPSSLVDTDHTVEDPTQADFFKVYDQLVKNGVGVKPDRQEAWNHYRELRSRYAEAIEYMAKLTMAPEMKSISGR
ncbi:hypothetical protein [Hymenobacter jejuensis]|uniref:Uncharacterized protein n=1 Tax=Hymenobacter jejuensis TaxID=2502781 RepID=A0A5B7ZZA9_9BACT|nr:hypothetical protein [Hymenobacter jejuensis]QDA59783.1 hypothetical protein FHG12_06540 [Hymenobacter jejuensis]